MASSSYSAMCSASCLAATSIIMSFRDRRSTPRASAIARSTIAATMGSADAAADTALPPALMPPGGGGGRSTGGGWGRRTADAVKEFDVSLEELYKGKQVKMMSKRKVVCSSCKG